MDAITLRRRVRVLHEMWGRHAMSGWLRVGTGVRGARMCIPIQTKESSRRLILIKVMLCTCFYRHTHYDARGGRTGAARRATVGRRRRRPGPAHALVGVGGLGAAVGPIRGGRRHAGPVGVGGGSTRRCAGWSEEEERAAGRAPHVGPRLGGGAGG